MSKKTILLIIVAVGILVYIAWPKITPEFGSQFKGEVPSVTSSETSNIKGVKLICDESGSMKGYVDFNNLNGGANNNIVGTISLLVNNIDRNYNDLEEFSAVCGNRRFNRAQDFISELRSNKVFTSKSTLLWNLIDDGVKYASDTSVSIILSDMVLSYGRNVIRENSLHFNADNRDGLKGEIVTNMTKAKKKKLDVVIIQYLSDFNGYYYCNNQENLESLHPEKTANAYNGKKMEQRPYYVMLIGKKENLESIIAKGCLAECKNMYASYLQKEVPLKEESFIVEPVKLKDKDVWRKGHHKSDVAGVYGLYLPDKTTSFDVSCEKFTLQRYYYKNNSSFEAVCGDKISAEDIKYENGKLNLKLKTENLNKSFRRRENGSFSLKVYAKNDWIKESSCDDDVDKLDGIKGKTWGFKSFMDGINSVYYPEGYTSKTEVASIEFGYYINE